MWDIFMRREKITEFITFYLFQLMDMRTLVEWDLHKKPYIPTKMWYCYRDFESSWNESFSLICCYYCCLGEGGNELICESVFEMK